MTTSTRSYQKMWLLIFFPGLQDSNSMTFLLFSNTLPVVKYFQGPWILKTEFRHIQLFFKGCKNPALKIQCAFSVTDLYQIPCCYCQPPLSSHICIPDACVPLLRRECHQTESHGIPKGSPCLENLSSLITKSTVTFNQLTDCMHEMCICKANQSLCYHKWQYSDMLNRQAVTPLTNKHL